MTPTLPEMRGETAHWRLPPKRCSRCREDRPQAWFRADHRASDGLRSQCIHCESDAERARYLRRLATDPESVRDRNVMAGRRYRARLAAGGV